MHLPVCIPCWWLPLCVPVYRSVCLPAYLSTSLPTYCLFLFLSVYLPACPSAYLSLHDPLSFSGLGCSCPSWPKTNTYLPDAQILVIKKLGREFARKIKVNLAAVPLCARRAAGERERQWKSEWTRVKCWRFLVQTSLSGEDKEGIFPLSHV